MEEPHPTLRATERLQTCSDLLKKTTHKRQFFSNPLSPGRGVASRCNLSTCVLLASTCDSVWPGVLDCSIQGRVVRKLVNANPGLKVNRSNNFSCIEVLSSAYLLFSLRLLMLKTEGPKNITKYLELPC